jgi:hypothetical protein
VSRPGSFFVEKSSRRLRRTEGFALLITVTLLAFLVLLLVSLASLTRVETQVAGNNQTLARARQNALLALNIALGQLQKHAGPDQRVTATAALGEADALNGGNADHRTALTGLVAPQNGTRLWTGIWGNPDAPDRSYTKTPTPVLLTWLVSGNENAPAVSASADGHITTPATANATPLNPASPIPSLINATALSDLGNWKLLVGPETAEDPANYAVAEIQTISANQIPGMPPTASLPVGRYAWWVGDQGVKARYNLRDRHAPAAGAPVPDTTTPAGRHRLGVAQRSGIERLTGFGDYPINTDQLAGVLEHAQLTLSQPALTATALKRSASNLTFHSEGVLASSQSGGLRRDLSHHLFHGDLNGRILPVLSALAGIPAEEASARNEINALANPRWELLNSFRAQSVAAASGVVDIVPGDAAIHGLTPVIVQLRTLIRLRIDPAPVPDDDRAAFLGFSPIIVLGNPYTVRLRSVDGVDFRYHAEGGRVTGESSTQGIQLTGAGTLPAQPLRLLKRHDSSPSTRSLWGNVVLRTPAFTLEPGELKLFSLAAGGAASGSGVPVFDLVEGDASLDPTRAVDLAIGTVPATALNDPPLITDRKWTLRVDLGANGNYGSFSFSMYPRSNSYPSANAINPLAGRPLQRIEEVGLGGGVASVAGYNHEFNAPEKNALTGPSAEAFLKPYYSRRQHLVMPGAQMGRQRTYADFNIRAQLIRRPLVNNTGINTNPLIYAVAPVSTGAGAEVFFGLDLPARWGRSVSSTTNAGTSRVVLFDLLQADDGPSPFLSVAALQHASLTAIRPDNLVPLGANNDMTVADQPAYAVGNSWANPYLSRHLSAQARTLSGNSEAYFDTSYLLNTALLDDAFFSTVPQQSGATLPAVLPNGRLRSLSPDIGVLQDGAKAAAHLMIEGAFNINSTSPEAWRAVLAGLRFGPDNTIHRRSLHQPGGSANAGTGTSADAYQGYRILTDAQVNALADQIVSQVRRRGPFMSLAHFANRKLTPAGGTATESALGLKGALQSALDAGVNNPATFDLNTTGTNGDNAVYLDPEATLGPQAAGIPGWVTQADLLQTLGPVLSARSDTFTIRTYGEVLDPVNSTAATPVVLGRAWCEAVVQRIPEPVRRKSSDPASADYNEPAAATASQPDFGRRFQVVTFRWLGPSDI